MTMKSLKLLSLCICVCLAIYVNSVKCDEDDSPFTYDGEISMSNIDDANKDIYEDEISPLPDSGLVLEHEMIYEQSDQPVSGERFIAVRVDKMGATENLKPNLVGLSNMAIQFLPKDYKLVEVVEATREIISGVRYELLVAAQDENNEAVLCRIVVTEITWKLTAWGDKQRVLNYSNCTSNATTDDDDVPNSNDFSFNPLFVRKTNFISDDDLKLIESQIINPKQMEKVASKPKTSEMPDFDLSNLEAMIIPSKSSVKTIALPKAQIELNDHSFELNTQIVSDSKTDRDCSQLFEKEFLSKSQALPETQLKVDSVDEATAKSNYEHSHEDLANTSNSTVLSPKKSTTDTERSAIEIGATESGQQENTLSGPKLEEITLKSEDVDTQSFIVKDALKLNDGQYIDDTERSDIGTTETTIETQTIPENQATEFESLEEATTLIAALTENNERNEDDVEDRKVLPKIESVSLRMEDTVVPSSETVVIFETLTEEDKGVNEYSTESYVNQQIVENQKIDRTKRAINTEMIFLEQLTKEALEQLDYVDSDNFKRVALNIIRVKRIERENGATYVIKVRTANSDCVEESDDHQTCLDNVIKDTTKICFIEIQSKRDVNKVTKSECAPDKSYDREAEVPIRFKRQTNPNGIEAETLGLGAPSGLGAPFDADPAEAEKIKELVTSALTGFNKKPNNKNYGLHRVKSSQKQIVAGVLYRVHAEFVLPNNDIKDCYIEFAVREWVKPEPDVLKLDCGEVDEATRKKRSLFYDSRMEDEAQETEYDRNVSMMFDEFKVKFNKKYESAMEHATRLRLFKHNLHVINELNRLEMGTATYGVTEFADFTLHEYKQKTGLLRRRDDNEIPLPMADIPDIDLPKSFDWRDKGAVTNVKNQGNCGSCWAFSVTGNIEGLNAIKTGKLEEFSEQELVDCDTVDSGCNGGLPDNAYKAIEQIGGLETESAYPYSAKKSKCQFDPSLSRVKVSGAVDLPQNETAMALYLVQNGPLSIGINANAMQFYRGGISHPPRILCRHGSIDHGVLIVGYGVADYPVFNKTLPFWIVKNSWGPSWGEKGYYRVFRGADTCGLTSMVSSAVLG